MKNLTSIQEHSDWLFNQHIRIDEKWDLHRQRVDFGKQKLEIWQFIPCKLFDGVWVVLEEPEKWNYFVEKSKQSEFFMTNKECVEYQEAKEKCVFNNNLLSLDKIKELIKEQKTVEFLINYYYEETGSYLETNRELF